MKEQKYYEEIKNSLIKNEIYKRVKDYSKNRSDLSTYYNVGKLLSEAGKHYGEGIIREFSIKLTNELDKKYSSTTLKRMRQFYWLIIKGAPLVDRLTWSHYCEIIPLNSSEKISYYIDKSIKNNLSKRQLRELIKNHEYERLSEDTKNKLIHKEKINIKDLVPNSIIIENKNNIEIVNEYALQNLI